MRVTLVTLSGTETEREFEEDATVGQIRAKVASFQNVKVSWVSLMLRESELSDDSALLKDAAEGKDIRLNLCVRQPWSWAEKVDGTVRSLDEYKQDPELSILLQHFNGGNGGEGHGRIVVSGKFPVTALEMLAFLRGEALSEEDQQFVLKQGTQCWGRDGDEGAEWRPAKVLCCAHCGDIVNHYTVEWTDGKSRSGGDEPDLRLLEDKERGYTSAMTKGGLESRLAKGSCHEKSFSEQFGYVDAEDAWSKLPVAPQNVETLVRAQLAARPPSASLHDEVSPGGEDGAPWQDVLELKEVGPEHVAAAAQQSACYVSVPEDHADRAARALRALVGASPEDSQEAVQENVSRCKFYTHSRTVDDGEGSFFWVTGMGWDPLVIVANPEDATIAFAFANGTD